MLKKQPMIHGLSKLKCSRQFIILVKTLARSEHNGIHIHDTHNNCQLSAECGGWKWHQHKIFERKNLFHFRYFFFWWVILWWSHRLQRGILLEMLFMYNSFYLCWWIVLCATDEDLFAHTFSFFHSFAFIIFCWRQCHSNLRKFSWNISAKL